MKIAARIPVPATGSGRLARRHRKPAGLTAVALLTLAAEVMSADWPQWRGPNRDSTSPETGWLKYWPPTEVWRKSVGAGFSSVAISEGRLYTMGYSGSSDYVYCLDASNGTQMWAKAYACSAASDGGYTGPRATPVVDGDRLYTFSRRGEVRCWNRFTGSNVWTTAISCTIPSWALTGSPFVEGDIVYVHAGARGVALNKHTGATAWSNSGGKAGKSSPFTFTYNSQRLIGLYSADIGFVAVDAATGVEAMRYTKANADYNCADPIIYQGDKVFLSCGRASWCGLIRLGSGTLSSVWTGNSMLNQYNTSVLLGDYLYGITGGNLRCLSVGDNLTKWTKTGLSLGEGSLIASDGKLIVLGQSGRLRVVKASSTGYDEEGRALYTISGFSGEGRPLAALSNGRLYCRSDAGTLVCLKVGDAAARPQIANGAASAVTRRSADLNATLVSPGSAPAQAWFCWGGADGGQSLAGWDTVAPLGERAAGPVSHTVTGLTAGATYHYTTCASNSVGATWPAAGASFATPPPLELSVVASPTNGLAPLSVQFTASPRGGAAYAYAWAFGDGATSIAADPLHVYTNPGVYAAVLVVDDGLDAVAGAVDIAALDPDANTNGIADAWEGLHFPTNVCVADADSDGDGRSNLDEYITGTDPNLDDSGIELAIAGTNGGNMLISCDTMPAVGIGYENRVRYYTLEQATGLDETAWAAVPGLSNVAAAGVLSHATNPPANALFYRIKTRLQ